MLFSCLSQFKFVHLLNYLSLISLTYGLKINKLLFINITKNVSLNKLFPKKLKQNIFVYAFLFFWCYTNSC